MTGTATPPRLLGRRTECEALSGLVAAAKAGRSQVLVLRGEAGIGKTALLDFVLARATGCQTARAVGVESELELAFAGLHQLCSPHLDRLAKLPGPQQEALGTAFGLRSGSTPDRFLVGLAVLTLLSEVAGDRPLVCVVDDLQWLDQASAQALEFVARRLAAEPVAMVFAVRPTGAEVTMGGFPELVLRGLHTIDAAALLTAALPATLDPRVRDRVLEECHGNPLALLELPRGSSAADLAVGSHPGGTPPPVVHRLEQGFLRQVEPLPAASRTLLLVAAAEPVGDLRLLQDAAGRLGIEAGAAADAEAAGLIEVRDRVRFRHPLIRTVVYRSASLVARREVHAALADATDPEEDPDRRAWHRACAVTGPAEDVAAELHRSADRAYARGGLAAAAAFLERAAELTVDRRRRAERLLAAAAARQQSGATDAALELLGAADSGPLDELQRARAGVLRGQIAFLSADGRRAPGLLLEAAAQLEALDAGLARDTYRDALTAALFVGRLAGDTGVVEVAQGATRSSLPSSERPPDLLLEGLTCTITQGPAAGTPTLRRAVRAISTADVSDMEAIRWLWLATHAAHDVWDDEAWDRLSERHIRVARAAGALTVLPLPLSARVGLLLCAGELRQAAALVDEIAAVTEVTGNRLPPYGALALAARQGRVDEASALIRAVREELAPRGEGMGLALVDNAEAVLCLGSGRYDEAFTAAADAAAHPEELGFASLSLPELVEAASRSGRPERAAEALDRIAATAVASGTEWGLGILARSQALVGGDHAAEVLYREAIERLGRTRMRLELARARLLYGEWLRRAGRRVDAREQLRSAHEMFAGMGAEAFAERSRHELLATGETVRKRTVATTDQLTAQESHIARLAAQGMTNPEIGAELYISPRTVEWHLRKVFAKLGVATRRELRRSWSDREPFGARDR